MILQELYDHGRVGHGIDPPKFWEERINVPLLMCLPESEKQAMSSEPRTETAIIEMARRAPLSSHVDILPTVISAISRGSHLMRTLAELRNCAHGQSLSYFLTGNMTTSASDFRLIFGHNQRLMLVDATLKAMLSQECTDPREACLQPASHTRKGKREWLSSLTYRRTATHLMDSSLQGGGGSAMQEVEGRFDGYRNAALDMLPKVCEYKLNSSLLTRTDLQSKLRDIRASPSTEKCVWAAIDKDECREAADIELFYYLLQYCTACNLREVLKTSLMRCDLPTDDSVRQC